MIKENQVYEPLSDIRITCMTSWRAPFTGGYERVLSKGERFRICNNPEKGASAVYCDPLRYKELHKEMVPCTDRWRFWIYSGYYFCIDLKTISQQCRLVEES